VGYWIDIGPNDADADASTTERLFRDGPWDKETEERKRNETLESSWQPNGCMGWLIWEGVFIMFIAYCSLSTTAESSPF
jgi:hypothetical protein